MFFTGALRVHAAAVQLDEVPDQREADSQPSLAACAPALALTQSVEDIGQHVGRDALPGVADDDLDVRPNALELDLDSPILRGELDGVVQQVPDDLLQPAGVAADQQAGRLQHRVEPNALRLGRVTDRFQRVVDELAEIDGLHGEPQPAIHDLRHVEQVVDEADLRPDVPDDDLDRSPSLRFTELTALDQCRPPVHGVERVAQLVRERREEFVLRAVRRFGRAARRPFSIIVAAWLATTVAEARSIGP